MVSKHIYRMQSPPLFWDFHSITNMLPVISKPPCGVEWFSKFSQRLKNKLKKCWVLPDFSKWLLSHLARLIHLDLWSSLSGVIWMSLAIVSSMWQPALGSIYLSSSGVKKKRSITNTSWFVWTCVFSLKTSGRSQHMAWHDVSPLIPLECDIAFTDHIL